MKKPFITVFALVCLASSPLASVYANNIIAVETRRVDGENIKEFIKRESTYAKAIAEKAIADDKLSDWQLWERIDGFDLHDDHNFLFVNIYTPEQFDLDENIWDFNAVFPKNDLSEMQTLEISTVHDLLYYENLAFVSVEKPKIIRINYAKSSQLGLYIESEPRVWGPFIEERMKSKKTNVVSWEFSRLVFPRGTYQPHDAVSIDGFRTLGDAIRTDFSSDTIFPNLDELLKIHDKVEVHVYSLVARADSE